MKDTTYIENVIAEADQWLETHRKSETWRTMNRLRDTLVRYVKPAETTTRWGVRYLDRSDAKVLPAVSREDAEKTIEEMCLGYPWPEEITLVSCESTDWKEEA